MAGDQSNTGGTANGQTTPNASQSAVSEARSSFPNAEPAPVTPCEPGQPAAPPPAPPCSADKIKANIAACDGGTHIWDAAKQGLGKDPTVVVTPIPSGFKADTDIQTGVIRISPRTDCCSATLSLFFELTNARSAPRHKAVDDDAAAGNVSRDDYAKQAARVEYDGLVLRQQALGTCRSAWGCSATATTGFENISSDFDTYYRTQTTQRYRDYYKDAWDSNYKAAYDAKHPPTPAPGGAH